MCPARGQVARQSLRPFVERAVALLAPPRCAACDSPAPSGAVLCGACERALAALPPGARAARRGDSLAAHFAAYPMVSPARDLVHALKYRSAAAVSRQMAARIAERAPPSMLRGAVLVPVPAHPARLRRRGYNQCALLAGELARLCGLPVGDLLARAGSAPPQTGQPRASRLRLDRSAFVARSRPLRGLLAGETFPTNVVLVDDVVTTGVTLELCAFAIRRRFGSEVRALTFASTSADPGNRIGRCR